jgi:hypothetical protein
MVLLPISTGFCEVDGLGGGEGANATLSAMVSFWSSGRGISLEMAGVG